MSGILGLNAVECAAAKGMGIGSFRTFDNQMMTIMRNPKTQQIEFYQHPLGTDIRQSNFHGKATPKKGEIPDNILKFLESFAKDKQDFYKAKENSLRIIA